MQKSCSNMPLYKLTAIEPVKYWGLLVTYIIFIFHYKTYYRGKISRFINKTLKHSLKYFIIIRLLLYLQVNSSDFFYMRPIQKDKLEWGWMKNVFKMHSTVNIDMSVSLLSLMVNLSLQEIVAAIRVWRDF